MKVEKILKRESGKEYARISFEEGKYISLQWKGFLTEITHGIYTVGIFDNEKEAIKWLKNE